MSDTPTEPEVPAEPTEPAEPEEARPSIEQQHREAIFGDTEAGDAVDAEADAKEDGE
jgi:hypothetical protein